MVTGDENLVELYEEILVSLLIGLHRFSELQVQVFLHFEERKSLADYSVVSEDALDRGDEPGLGVTQMLVLVGIHSKSGEQISHGYMAIHLGDSNNRPLLPFRHVFKQGS